MATRTGGGNNVGGANRSTIAQLGVFCMKWRPIEFGRLLPTDNSGAVPEASLRISAMRVLRINVDFVTLTDIFTNTLR